MPHPWFVTEDSHVNMLGVLEYFDNFTEPGDYICVEDTNPLFAPQGSQELSKQMAFEHVGVEKLKTLKTFMKNRSHRYVVDQRYTDFFGWVYLTLSVHLRVMASYSNYSTLDETIYREI